MLAACTIAAVAVAGTLLFAAFGRRRSA